MFAMYVTYAFIITYKKILCDASGKSPVYFYNKQPKSFI